MGGPVGQRAVLEAALNACNRLTGIGFHVEAEPAVDALPGVIVVATPERGPAVRFAAIERQAIRTQEIGALADLARKTPYPLLLAAQHVNPQAAERARQLGVAFVDLAGNAHLHGPGLFVLITGRRAPAGPRLTRAPRAFTPAGLKVVFAVLFRPQLLAAPLREIAAATGVALGTVAAVMEDLVARGYVTPEGIEEKRLLAPQRLAEEWTLIYPVRLRPKLVRGRYAALDPGWWERARLTPGREVWGGEVAADRLTGRLAPARQTLYVWGDPAEFLLANRLRPDERGDVEILEAFWKPAEDGGTVLRDVAPPLLVYADLMATGDPRNVEVARVVRERHLRGILGPA